MSAKITPADGKVFFDTNVLVYQFDKTEPNKQGRAIELIEKCILSGQAVISSQVVQEFMNVALKKFDTMLTDKELALIADKLLKPLCKHFPTFEHYTHALKLYSESSVSFYDALIIQAALESGSGVLYSEDLQDGQKFGTLTIVNPFTV